MADDERDRRKIKTPPHGVARQIAPVAYPESWEDGGAYTPLSPTPAPGSAQANQIISGSDMHDIDRRVRETKNTSITTLDRVEVLRRETREDIRGVTQKIESVDAKVDGVVATVGKQEGQLEKLDVIVELLKDREHVENTLVIARSDIDRHRQITATELAKLAGEDQIEAKKERRKNFWALVWKGVAAAGAVWLVVSVGLIAYMKQCGK